MTPAELKKKAAAETISWAHGTLALAYSEIGAAVDADERTVRRWRVCEVAPQARHQAKLEELRELRHLLSAVFPTQAAANEWLHSSVPAFRGRSPISVIRDGRIESVIDVLAAMESGAFV